MDPSLEVHVQKAMAGEVEFKDWIEVVKIKDEFVVRGRREAKEMIAREISRSEQEKAKNAPTQPKYTNMTATSQPGLSGKFHLLLIFAEHYHSSFCLYHFNFPYPSHNAHSFHSLFPLLNDLTNPSRQEKNTRSH